MEFVTAYSHHRGLEAWRGHNLFQWLTQVFSAPDIQIAPRATPLIRKHIKDELALAGWAFNVRIDSHVELSVFARKNDLVIQLQTGNISRYAYDLLKIQHLYAKKSITAAALAVPTREASQILGSNIAHVDRICSELEIFDRVITVPLIVIAFA